MTTYSKRQLARLAAGQCLKCTNVRTALEGHTRDLCAPCAEKSRARQLKASRLKRGIPVDAPIRKRKRGPRKDHVSDIERSDVFLPDLAPGVRPKRKQMYGSLTLEEIRRETSKLPLKPPGK